MTTPLKVKARRLDKDEIDTIRKGDVVSYMTSKGMTRGIIVQVDKLHTTSPAPLNKDESIVWRFFIQKEGKTANGRNYPCLPYYPNDLRKVYKLNPQTANVYADWLEENNEPWAARKLREAFPLDNGK